MAVKIILEQQAPGAQTEVIIRCAQENDREVQQVIALLELQNQRIVAVKQGETMLLAPTEVLYCEAVDGNVYLYLKKEVCKTLTSLAQLEQIFANVGFFRCSKSMVVNLHGIAGLKSGTNGRIIVTLQNKEKILVSRHYAGALRERLQQS
ncbi:MAG: LytTR family DNA-binding domain-containing protein [Clostridium sp.]